MTLNADFKSRLIGRELLLGAFIKTPHPIIVDVMGRYFDFLVLDAEHAPFDRNALDIGIITGLSVGCPILVRVASHDPSTILNVLDCGAAGIMAPHVVSVEQATALARSTQYVSGGRGLAGTTRAAGYGARSLTQHIEISEDEVSLICQIEDVKGAELAAEIAAVDGVDALFVGRTDLAQSIGTREPSDPRIHKLCSEVIGVKAVATGLYCTGAEDANQWSHAGATLLVVGSEHSLMIEGAHALREKIDSQIEVANKG